MNDMAEAMENPIFGTYSIEAMGGDESVDVNVVCDSLCKIGSCNSLKMLWKPFDDVNLKLVIIPREKRNQLFCLVSVCSFVVSFHNAMVVGKLPRKSSIEYLYMNQIKLAFIWSQNTIFFIFVRSNRIVSFLFDFLRNRISSR